MKKIYLDYNKYLADLLEKCNKVGATILIIDYSSGTGVIELSDGTPSSIVFKDGAWVQEV